MGQLKVAISGGQSTERDCKLADDEEVSLAIVGTQSSLVPTSDGVASEGEVKVINLHWYRKCLFAMGGAPYQMLTNAIGFFVSIYLLNAARLHPFLSSIVLLGGRVCDALTDPLIGVLVEKSPSFGFGKLKSWIMCSMPFTCAAYCLFWYVPEPFRDATQTNISEQFPRFAYYFVLMLVLQLLFTCHQVPFSSLTMYISNNKKVRDSATAFRMAFEMMGVLVGVLVSSLIIKGNGSCSDTNSTVTNCSNSSYEVITPNYSSSATEYEYTDDEIRGSFVTAAFVLVAVHVCCVMCVIFGVKEHRSVKKSDSHEPFLKGLRHALGFRPYIILMFAFLQIGFVMQNVQANLVLYVTYTLKLDKKFLFFGLFIMLATGVICVPLWQLVQRRYGKRTAFAGGLIAVLPALLAMLFVPPSIVAHPIIYFPLCAVSGASVSVAYLCPWSMLPDVIDAYFLKKGVRHTSVFYSFYVFFSKLAVGVAIGVSQAILGIVGYDTGNCNQPEAVAVALRYLISVPSLVAAFGSLICVWLYPITESVRAEHDAKLRRIKQFDDDSTDSFISDCKLETVPVCSATEVTEICCIADGSKCIVRPTDRLLAAPDTKSDHTESNNSSTSSSCTGSNWFIETNHDDDRPQPTTA